jgi:hypothetical protein
VDAKAKKDKDEEKKRMAKMMVRMASAASFLTAVFTEIYLCHACSCQEILRRNGRGQGGMIEDEGERQQRLALQVPS